MSYNTQITQILMQSESDIKTMTRFKAKSIVADIHDHDKYGYIEAVFDQNDLPNAYFVRWFDKLNGSSVIVKHWDIVEVECHIKG